MCTKKPDWLLFDTGCQCQWLFWCVSGENLPFGLMGISTMDGAILVKRLGITHFLRRKISLSKTLKSGLLSECSALGFSRTSAQTWADKALFGMFQKQYNSHVICVFTSVVLPFTYYSYNFGVYFSNHVSVPEFFCLHHGLGPCSITAGWSLVSVWQHFDHKGHHIFNSSYLSLLIGWCSVVNFFFFNLYCFFL